MSGQFVREFWERVDMRGPDECWPWRGGEATGGYGVLHNPGRRAPLKAHRMAWVLGHRRMIPDGAYILHSCDNPSCCNPDHLRPGSALDNTQDMIARGRDRKALGEDAANVKLTAEQVEVAREVYARGRVSVLEVATLLGLDPGHCVRVLAGDVWRHVGGPLLSKGSHEGRHLPHIKLSAECVREARERRAAGELVTDLAADYGVHHGHMSRVLRGLLWKNAGGPLDSGEAA